MKPKNFPPGKAHAMGKNFPRGEQLLMKNNHTSISLLSYRNV
jgi:hypothetical protein